MRAIPKCGKETVLSRSAVSVCPSELLLSGDALFLMQMDQTELHVLPRPLHNVISTWFCVSTFTSSFKKWPCHPKYFSTRRKCVRIECWFQGPLGEGASPPVCILVFGLHPSADSTLAPSRAG